MPLETKTDLILGLLDEYEISDCNRRNEALEITLYLLQGCFKECNIESECLTMIQENAYLLYSLEVFSALCDMLASECEQVRKWWLLNEWKIYNTVYCALSSDDA